jgi:hypothetical protein
MTNDNTTHWRVKGSGGILLYSLALAGGGMEVWNNLLNAPDDQSRVVAFLAVAALMLIPFGVRCLDSGEPGRIALYAAIFLAFAITAWSGLKAYTNSQGHIILAVGDTKKALGSAQANEADAKRQMAAAEDEAATARKEASKIDPEAVAKAEVKLAKAKAATVAPLEAYSQEQAILTTNGITCEMRPLNCPPLRTKAAAVRAEMDAAAGALAAAMATAKVRADALARAEKADAKADSAKTWLQASQGKQEQAKTTETAGIHTMIASYWGLDASHVARIDGLGEAIARLAFTLALSLCATPGAMLIGAAWQDFHRVPVQVIHHAEILPTVREPETVTIIDKTGLRPLVLRMLQEHGPAGSQKELARRIAQHCLDIERVAESTLSEVLTALETSQEIEREQAGPAKIVRLANWKAHRRA